MMAVTGGSLQPIYDRLRNAPSYHPLSADTFADWSVEAGDVVTVTRDGKSYDSPVHSLTMTHRKGQQINLSSGGNEKRDAIAKTSQRKYGGGSGGLRNGENAYYSIETSYNNMVSGLELASSSASLYVEDMYRQMKSGLALTSSSAALYAGSRDNAARIVAQINESTGQSEIILDAKKVYMGDPKNPNNRVNVIVNGKLETDRLAAEIANIPYLTVQAIALNGGLSSGTGDIRTGGTVGGAKLYLGGQNMDEAFVNATVSGSRVTLTKVNGRSVSFSKAVTVERGWSGGKYTVTPTEGEMTPADVSTTLNNNGSSRAYISNGVLSIPVDSDLGYTGKEVYIGTTRRENATGNLHRYNTNNQVTLYVKVTDTGSASDFSSVGRHFWYYKDQDTSLATWNTVNV